MNETERLVMKLYGEGKSVADIAGRLGKKESTVYTYLTKNGQPQRKKKSQLGISAWRIKQARNRAKEGSKIRVKSVKILGEGNIKHKSVRACLRQEYGFRKVAGESQKAVTVV